ncbi:hypothetical protein [Novosphingobium sp. JCM 18896]|uniref:hypothetical protein n=1 Tax=Novosphingobium sp. JCM 18896 TaxID=2989731 RepID=UPI002221BBB5|nr:hypothetical protein [Novosphingobium sp. JCM 18896]MCW1431980.1 hypothetical protein [Novosphingobium sp. JCM 18896]
MSYDLDFRFRRALHPEGLTTFASCMAALNDAASDAQRAGYDPGGDPAVKLFARRLSRLAEGALAEDHPDDGPLREACLSRLAELKHKPAIVALLRKGIDYMPEDLRAFRREGQRALRQIAFELGLARADYRLDYVAPNASIAGDYVLEGDVVYMRLSVERFGSPALTYRHRHWKRPGNQVRHASAGKLADIPALARQIAVHLQIEVGRSQPTLM